VAGGDLCLDPGQELSAGEFLGGLDGAVVALDGGDDQVQIDIQAQLENVVDPG
jgi:hypothetical protein